jgi:hypothetical protein
VEIVEERPRPDPDRGADPLPAGGTAADGDEGAMGTPPPDDATRTPDGSAVGHRGEEEGPYPEDGVGHADGKDPLRFNNWRKRSAAGAVMTGIAVGLQQALEVPKKQPAFVIVASDEPDEPSGPIDLKFDPDSPADTVAIIRPPAVDTDREGPGPRS